MKKNVLKRTLAMLLVLATLLSAMPMGVWAVTGDYVVGDTGVVNSSLGVDGTINWPIKIYDYLNDGMLFEPATANRITGDTSGDSVLAGWYGLYGGGENMPETLQGTDYTGNSAHYGSGDTTASITTTTPSYTLTKIQAEHYVSPQYMRIQKSGTTDGNSLCLVNFTKDAVARNTPGGYQHCLPYDDVRYMVLVYKGQGIASGDNVQIWLESYSNATLNSSGLLEYSGTWSNVTYDITIPDSDGWSALVVDLATVDPDLYMSNGTATTWDSWNACTAAYLRIPGIDTGDVLDLSHVAFFGTEEEAELYGQRAVAFDNDPGECLLKARTITLTEGTPTYYTYPTASAPTWNFSLKHDHSTINATATPSYRYGMNFADGTGKNMGTYARWKTGETITVKNASNTSQSIVSDKMTVAEPSAGTQSYVSLSSTNASSKIILSEFNENGGVTGTTLVNYGNKGRYLVLVYRTTGYTTSDKLKFWTVGYTNAASGCSGSAWWASYPDGAGATSIELAYYGTTRVEDGWVYLTIDLSTLYSATYIKYVGMTLPTGSGKRLDLAYVGYLTRSTEATTFGKAAVAYMNQDIKVQTGTSAGQTVTFPAGRVWNSGNNASFGLYLGNQGGGWSYTSTGASNSDNGGNNTTTNGYYNYRIGYDTTKASTHLSNQNRKPFGEADNLFDAYYTATSSNAPQTPTSGKTNQIYYVKLSSWANSNDGSGSTTQYTTNHLDFDGYDLRTTLTSGGMTMGLLEGQIVDGRPVYRQETVEYVAELLYNTLRIPQFDATGNYNYNFISGAVSDQYATDLNGDGDTLDMIDTNGDQVAETSEAAMDLATALRYQLGIKFSLQQNKGTAPTFGDYAATADKDLLGSFESCRGNITTCMDAAYFLLNNLFVGGSYNQIQDDFSYLTLSHATMDETDENGNPKTAYVFDAGYGTGAEGYTEGTQISYLEASKYTSTSAVQYRPYSDGGDGTISLGNVGSKDLWCYLNEDTTTRFPFMPVVDAEDEYANEIRSPYFRDDGSQMVTLDKNTYVNRNYNYVMASNGEFVYYEDDDLFFEFEGDDDVYLFINGQLVLDIGGAHSITKVKFNVNDYVEWARNLKKDADAYAALSEEEQARVDALALEEEQICSFDFYYMERHGYGANCRIVTNMHVTDPNLKVEKSAQQFGEEVSYGGVVEPASPIGYTFKLTNTGNTKLYNLTFTDDVIGVTLDPEKGLVVENGWNGNYVFDAKGGTLEASDLTAKIITPGTDGDSVINVSFTDNQALINFLKTLSADGTESGQDDAEVTHAGSGLWVDTTVIITGMHYLMNSKQIEDGMVHNTVYVTATTKKNPTSAGSQTLRSDASHRVYTAGAPIYYQWADHEIFLKDKELLDDATREAGVSTDKIDFTNDSLLSQYNLFFKAANNDPSSIHIAFCDKKGVAASYSEITDTADKAGNNGFAVNYKKSGSYTFYLLMYLKADKTITYTDADNNSQAVTLKGYPADTAIGSMEEGSYAIVPVTIHVADVQDSTFVLDYGLGTESLDVNGELFKDDELFGSSGAMKAKLMGVSTTAPSYLKYSDSTSTDYNRISFDSLNLSGSKKITPFTESGDADGYFTMNMTIPGFGKTIAYDSTFGGYTITGVGTVTINAEVPADWESVYLYYWYDGTRNNGWPGTAMNYVSPGKFRLDIPADVNNIIINNGQGTQTKDLAVTAGVESTIRLDVNESGELVMEDGEVQATVTSIVADSVAYITVPEGWGDVYLYAWRDDNTYRDRWPGVQITEQNEDGYYVANIPGDTSYIIVNNGDKNTVADKQTYNLDIYSGKDIWVDVGDFNKDVPGNDGSWMYAEHHATITYSKDPVTIHAKVPASWGDSINLHGWYTGTGVSMSQWPGTAMTLDENGWFTLEGIPGGINGVIINNGDDQTVDLVVDPGMEAWITVTEETLVENNTTKNKAVVAYNADGSAEGFTFTPTKIMDSKYSLWMAITVHSTGKTPSALGTGVNINHEVQMYKKVTVLPATVVYYEDDFSGINYTIPAATDDEDKENSFTYHGEGSGSLTQSVDQTTVYGSDPVYQSGTNTLYSGDSMTKVQIMNPNQVAAFTFTGTGLELISRTNAFDSATIVMKVYGTTTATDGTLVKNADPLRNIPVITEFDNGNNGGAEEIYQVPAIRVKDLPHGTYIVEISGNPSYDFTNWDGNIANLIVVPTYLYIDGIRIYQPLGEKDDFYNASESGAVFKEFRDLIVEGKVAVADMDATGLKVSSGTTTWTENLLGDDFGENSAAFVGNKVDSTDDYMIMGPNNEVYMDGTVSNTALAFYVAEDATQNHELQVALRALDYGKFYGTGSTGPNVVVEYGALLSDGSYVWRPLVNALSSTEQYYSIPYAQCPVVKDSEGKDCYQIALRAVNGETGTPAMVSYTSLKLLGLTLQNVTGVGESSNLYYQNGILIKNQYYLCDGKTEQLFDNGSLTVTFEENSNVYIKSVLGEKTTYYSLQSENTLGAVEAAPTEADAMLAVPAGTVTFTLTDKLNDTVTLTYTVSGSGEGEGGSEPQVTALNMVSLQHQMQARSLAAAQIEASEQVELPGLEAVKASLSFEDEIHYNIYFTADNLTDVQEMGLLLFSENLSDGTFYDAAQVISDYYAYGDEYMVRTDGIPAKNMGDVIYFKIYAKLTDGSYVYSDITGYNAVRYAQSILANSQNTAMKSLVVAMLNYGAEAQLYFGYNTDNLMNAGLTAEQQALVSPYNADLIASPVAADSSKVGDFTATGGFTGVAAAVVFEGAFAINYYVTPNVDADVTMYYWSLADYNAATVLTADNATDIIPMTGETKLCASITGIAAKSLEDTMYVAMVYEADGVRYCTGVKAYSLAAYCKRMAAKASSSVQALAQATAVYGYSAKQYFAQ